MKPLTHPPAAPRLLANRQQQPVAEPRSAWQKFSCGHAELKHDNQYDAAKFIKPTEQDCQKYFIDLEINEIATNKLFAFHTTRCQFFQDLA